MSLNYLHRLFLYGLAVTLLVFYYLTLNENFWSGFTHFLPAIGTAEFMSGVQKISTGEVK